MARTTVRQLKEIRNSEAYDDSVAPSEANFEINPSSAEADLNSLRSAVNAVLTGQLGNWWDGLVTPSSPDVGLPRGLNDLNTELHALERQRQLKALWFEGALTVPSSQNYVVLSGAQWPTSTIASTSTTSLGSVVAPHGGAFGTHSLTVNGGTALAPINLVQVLDGVTREVVRDLVGRRVWALAHSETATDGHTITHVTPFRVQLSFVTVNLAGTGLIEVPVAGIENRPVHFGAIERAPLELYGERGASYLGALSATSPEKGYKSFSYSSGLLSTVSVYADPSRTVLLFTKSFTYSSGLLSRVDVVRAADGFSFGKTFSYNVSDELEFVTPF